jgi:CheY-like chemotaxis protein
MGNTITKDQAVLRILIIDDYADVADSLALLARMWGHDARVAYEGLSGIELAQTFRPDIVLLDLGLPKVDGYQVAQRLRKIPSLAGVRLVAVTGHAGEIYHRQARAAGFDHFLTKPVEPGLLEQTLRRLAPTKPLLVQQPTDAAVRREPARRETKLELPRRDTKLLLGD